MQTLTVPVNSGGVLTTIDPVCQCEIQPFPCFLWFKAWMMEKILFHTSNVRRVLGRLREVLTIFCRSELTGLYTSSPQGLHRGLGGSYSDVEGFSPLDWNVFSASWTCNLNMLQSASSPPVFWGNASSDTVSMQHDSARKSWIPVITWSSMSFLPKALLGRSEDNKKWLDVKQAVFYTLALVSFQFSSATTAFLCDL